MWTQGQESNLRSVVVLLNLANPTTEKVRNRVATVRPTLRRVLAARLTLCPKDLPQGPQRVSRAASDWVVAWAPCVAAGSLCVRGHRLGGHVRAMRKQEREARVVCGGRHKFLELAHGRCLDGIDARTIASDAIERGP